MKTQPKTPPSRLCFKCHEAVHTHKDSIFVVQDGERRLYHTDCYQAYRKETIKKLRQEAKAQQGEERQRLATPCLTCNHKRTKVYTGSYDGLHVRVCINGHYQVVTENGTTPVSEYTAVVWKSNSYAWQGTTPTSEVVCTACMETIQRSEGTAHVLEKHATPPQEEVVPEVVEEVPPVEVQVEVNSDQHTQQKVGVSDLSLDDLLTELAVRVSTGISNLERATLDATNQARDLKALVEQLLRGGR